MIMSWNLRRLQPQNWSLLGKHMLVAWSLELHQHVMACPPPWYNCEKSEKSWGTSCMFTAQSFELNFEYVPIYLPLLAQ
jgi:hypothetical protein